MKPREEIRTMVDRQDETRASAHQYSFTLWIPAEMTIETDRLVLRQWKDEDMRGFAAMSRDPHVMEYFPRLCSEAESIEIVSRYRAAIEERGWGFWAVESKESFEFLGSVGLLPVASYMPIPPSLEVGWRLAREHWGKGYATEAATAAITFAFSALHEEKVVAFTAVENSRSRRVMEKIGMSEVEERFLHPGYPSSSELSKHVLYEIRRE